MPIFENLVVFEMNPAVNLMDDNAVSEYKANAIKNLGVLYVYIYSFPKHFL